MNFVITNQNGDLTLDKHIHIEYVINTELNLYLPIPTSLYLAKIYDAKSLITHLYGYRQNNPPVQYIRIAIVPRDINKHIHCSSQEYYHHFNSICLKAPLCNKLMLSDIYDIYDLKTVKKFNLEPNDEYIYIACLLGKVEILEWCKNKGWDIKFTKYILEIISKKGHVHLLEWFKNAGYSMKCYSNLLNIASEYGHVNVLDWWLKSGLTLKYHERALNIASLNGHKHVLEWWSKSNLPLKYNKWLLYWLYEYKKENKIDTNVYNGVLEWWKNSGLPIKYIQHFLHKLNIK
jgi:hypothetical protein